MQGITSSHNWSYDIVENKPLAYFQKTHLIRGSHRASDYRLTRVVHLYKYLRIVTKCHMCIESEEAHQIQQYHMEKRILYAQQANKEMLDYFVAGSSQQKLASLDTQTDLYHDQQYITSNGAASSHSSASSLTPKLSTSSLNASAR